MGLGYEVAEPSAGWRWIQISWFSDEPDDRGQLIFVQWLVLVPAAVATCTQRHLGFVDYLQNCFIKRSDKIFRRGFYFTESVECPSSCLLLLFCLTYEPHLIQSTTASFSPSSLACAGKCSLPESEPSSPASTTAMPYQRVIQQVWWSLFKWSIMLLCIWSVTNRSRSTSPHCWWSSTGYHK